MGKFNMQVFTNTAWAFVTLDLSDELLFAALAGVADWRVREFNVQDLANTAWKSNALLFAALAKAAQ